MFYGGKRKTTKVYHEENERPLADGDEFVKVCPELGFSGPGLKYLSESCSVGGCQQGGRGSEREGCLGPVVDQGEMIEGYTSGRFND